jgi:enoyl-CoA hydratase
MSLVLLDKKEKTAILTLNAPDSLNAMSEDMAKEFSSAIDAVRSYSEIRSLILTGAGRAFSAGGDLDMLLAKTKLSESENENRMLSFYHSFLKLRTLDIPTIAAINGHAIGAGLCVAIGCDIRIGATGAKFGFTFTKLGLHPGMGATYLLREVVGAGAASLLLLTGRVIESNEALRIGLVSQISDDPLEIAIEISKEIESCGPLATKQLLLSLREPPSNLKDALAREAKAQSVNYGSSEFLEGVNATKEKRRPNWG